MSTPWAMDPRRSNTLAGSTLSQIERYRPDTGEATRGTGVALEIGDCLITARTTMTLRLLPANVRLSMATYTY